MRFIVGMDSDETLSKAIRVPEYVTTPDGRRLDVRDWMASVPIDGAVEVAGTFLVSMEIEDES